jgi:hypothetical protein
MGPIRSQRVRCPLRRFDHRSMRRRGLHHLHPRRVRTPTPGEQLDASVAVNPGKVVAERGPQDPPQWARGRLEYGHSFAHRPRHRRDLESDEPPPTIATDVDPRNFSLMRRESPRVRRVYTPCRRGVKGFGRACTPVAMIRPSNGMTVEPDSTVAVSSRDCRSSLSSLCAETTGPVRTSRI